MQGSDGIMAYFYSREIPDCGSELQLSREESQHLSKTLRGKTGDKIQIINGMGAIANAEISSIDKKNVSCRILGAVQSPEPDIKIHLYLAPPRNSILTSLIKQCVELGVWEITLVECEFSVSKPKNKDSLFFNEIITGAKQSGNPWFPKVNPLVKFKRAFQDCSLPKFYGAVPEENQKKSEYLKISEAALWIGPEGGFSGPELDLLKTEAIGLTVGNWVLRVETACTGLVSLLNHLMKN